MISIDANPEPRTGDQDDATNHGVSTSEPAEGAGDAPAGGRDSPDA